MSGGIMEAIMQLMQGLHSHKEGDDYDRSDAMTIQEIVMKIHERYNQETSLHRDTSASSVLDAFQKYSDLFARMSEKYNVSSLDLSKLSPATLYYYMEHEDERKNPSWRNRIHRFHNSIDINQIESYNTWLEFTQLCYSQVEDEIREGLSRRGYKLLFASLEVYPMHIVGIKDDPNQSSNVELLIAVRGPRDVAEILNAIMDETIPYRKGRANATILRQGKDLFEQHKGLLEELSANLKNPCIKVTLAGHSIGAGVASIAGWEMKQYLMNLDVEVVGFGCPPIVTKDVAEHSPFITNIINDSDLVPRSSAATITNLFLDMLEFDWIPMAKRDVRHTIVSLQRLHPSVFTEEVVWKIRQKVFPIMDKYLTPNFISTDRQTRMPIELLPPGHLIHLYRDGVGISGCSVPNDFFYEIDVTRRMVTDHFLQSGYHQVFLEIMRQTMKDHHYRFEDQFATLGQYYPEPLKVPQSKLAGHQNQTKKMLSDDNKEGKEETSAKTATMASRLYSGLGLAPMVRASTTPLRILALEYGADFVYTEELIDRSISDSTRIENAEMGTVDYIKATMSAKSQKRLVGAPPLLLRIDPAIERGRLICQIGTGEPELALQAALHVHRDVDAIDVNMGCPKKFSVSGGMGSALLSDPDRACRIIRTLHDAMAPRGLPVSAKIRLFKDTVSTVDFMTALIDAGAQAVAVHGRRVGDESHHPADWKCLREVVKLAKDKFPHIPILLNGDFYTRDEITAFMTETGANGVLLARPALYNTSIFRKPTSDDDVGPFDYQSKLLLDRTTVVQDYIRLSNQYKAHFTNVKYVVCEFMNNRRHPIPRIPSMPQNWPGHQTIAKVCKCQNMDEMCRLWKVDSITPDNEVHQPQGEHKYCDSYFLRDNVYVKAEPVKQESQDDHLAPALKRLRAVGSPLDHNEL